MTSKRFSSYMRIYTTWKITTCCSLALLLILLPCILCGDLFSASRGFDFEPLEFALRTKPSLKLVRPIVEESHTFDNVVFSVLVEDTNLRRVSFEVLQPWHNVQFRETSTYPFRDDGLEETLALVQSPSSSRALTTQSRGRPPLPFPEVTISGPVELRIAEHTTLYDQFQWPRLSFPHQVDAGPTKRLIVGDGVQLTLRGLHGLALDAPLDAADLSNFTQSRVPLHFRLLRPVRIHSLERLTVKRRGNDALELTRSFPNDPNTAGALALGVVPVDFRGLDSMDGILRDVRPRLLALLREQGTLLRKIISITAKTLRVHAMTLELEEIATNDVAVWNLVVTEDRAGLQVASFERRDTAAGLAGSGSATVAPSVVANATLVDLAALLVGDGDNRLVVA
eukprot:gnl/Spiro4/489_TR272_c0_g1_i1.p1 gnl/Spiro4/489_TR272_c0_g1~~gnl/Spiro4/489_TR272_c0_g1_i1.p1  ORF type:complete len:414 (+),score=87.81 gnl/Spiro4/489_TR272_c0_g1_i1:56-1243(+)